MSGGAGDSEMWVTPSGAPALRFIRSHVLKFGEEKEISAVRNAQSLSRNNLAAASLRSGTGGSPGRCLQSPLPAVRTLLPVSLRLFPAGRTARGPECLWE